MKEVSQQNMRTSVKSLDQIYQTKEYAEDNLEKFLKLSFETKQDTKEKSGLAQDPEIESNKSNKQEQPIQI